MKTSDTIEREMNVTEVCDPLFKAVDDIKAVIEAHPEEFSDLGSKRMLSNALRNLGDKFHSLSTRVHNL